MKGILTDKRFRISSELNPIVKHIEKYNHFINEDIKSLSDLAIKFVLSNNGVTSIILGMDKKEYIDQAVKNIREIIAEAASKNIDTAKVNKTLAQFLEAVNPVRSRSINDPAELDKKGIISAGERLEKGFSNLREKLSEERLKELLASTVIGKTGYVYIIDYKGDYVLSRDRKRDGENIWYVEDDKGRFVIQDVIKKGRALKKGKIEYYTYPWRDSEEEKFRKQLVAIMHFPEKQWIVGVVLYPDELLESNFEEMKKKELIDLMAAQRLGKTGHLSIIGTKGGQKDIYILSEDRKHDGEKALWEKDARGRPFIKEIMQDSQGLGRNESRIKYYLSREPGQRRERQKIMAYVYFKPWNWIIIASAYLDGFFENIKTVRNQIIFICLLSLILGSSIIYFFVYIMTRTITQLVDKMKRVARGNLDVETDDIRVAGDRNEIGQLANAFKQMTDNLRQTTFSKDYVENIIGNMNDALFVIDKDMRIITINHAASLLINCDDNEILKYPVRDFFMSGEEGIRVFKEKILKGEVIENLEMALKDKRGNSIPVSINGAPLRDMDGKVNSVILLVRDISEHKRLLSELSEARGNLEGKVQKLEKSDRAMLFMVEDLNKTTKELKVARNKLEEKVIEIEKVNKELDDFTYIVSHDLKEPLRGVKAFTKLLIEEYSNKLKGEGREYLKVISESTTRMTRLIEDLLNLSRIGRIKNIEPDVDIDELLSDVKKNLAYSLEEKRVDLKLMEKFPKLTCDRIRLSEVFSNLISNAVKYSKKDVKPVIEVGYSEKGEFYEFYVKDNGIGIEKQYYGKVFQIFQRLHGKGEYEGTGAGLTIVKKIVENHGGKIWVESKAGIGSTFYFTMPKAGEVRCVKR